MSTPRCLAYWIDRGCRDPVQLASKARVSFKVAKAALAEMPTQEIPAAGDARTERGGDLQPHGTNAAPAQFERPETGTTGPAAGSDAGEPAVERDEGARVPVATAPPPDPCPPLPQNAASSDAAKRDSERPRCAQREGGRSAGTANAVEAASAVSLGTWQAPDRDAVVAQMRADNVSITKIAEHFGVSRNTVVGRCARLGLCVPRPPKPAPPEPPRLARLDELGPDDCRWPIGEPNEPGFGFCGAPQAPGRPYCAEHTAKAYIEITPRSASQRRRRDSATLDTVGAA